MPYIYRSTYRASATSIDEQLSLGREKGLPARGLRVARPGTTARSRNVVERGGGAGARAATGVAESGRALAGAVGLRGAIASFEGARPRNGTRARLPRTRREDALDRAQTAPGFADAARDLLCCDGVRRLAALRRLVSENPDSAFLAPKLAALTRVFLANNVGDVDHDVEDRHVLAALASSMRRPLPPEAAALYRSEVLRVAAAASHYVAGPDRTRRFGAAADADGSTVWEL